MVTVALAGHVDHGKTALVKSMTGVDPDRLVEEKLRGLTTDLGFAHLPRRTALGSAVGLVDVPGHERYLKNMLAGLAGIDGFLLAVSCHDGWMPQSQEHFEVLQLLGIRKGVVALTKCDLYDAEMIDLARSEVADHLDQAGMDDVVIRATSVLTGQGIPELLSDLTALAESVAEPASSPTAKMWIDRAFTVRGAGTVVTGTLQGRAVSVGDSLTIHPEGVRVRVRGAQVHGRAQEQVHAGNRVALNVTALEKVKVSRGNLLVGDVQAPLTSRFAVELETLKTLSRPLTNKGAYHVHVGTAQLPARVQSSNGRLEPGATGPGIVTLEDALPLSVGDRLIIRDVGRRQVVAGARVVTADLSPAPHGRRCSWKEIDARRNLSERELLSRHVSSCRATSLEDLAAVMGWPQDVVERVLCEPALASEIVVSGDLVYSSSFWTWLADDVRRRLEEQHRKQPLTPGMEREEVLAPYRLRRSWWPAVIKALVDAGIVAKHGHILVVPGYQIDLRAVGGADFDALLAAVTERGYEFPDLAELKARGFGRDLVEAAVRAGWLVKMDTLITTPDAVDAALHTWAQLDVVKGGAGLKVPAARDALGSSRKYILPLLYHCDEVGYTRRLPDDRRVITPAGRTRATSLDMAGAASG